MPHTAPDWSWMGKVATLFSLQDMGELAVRLGSIVTHDRRGNVLFIGTLESGLGAYYTETSGTGASVTVSTERFLAQGYSLKMIGGSDGSRYALAMRSLAYPALSKMGMECHVVIDDNLDHFDFEVFGHNGSSYSTFGIRYDHVNSKLQYRDDTPAWVDIATGVALYYSTYLFLPFKLVFDEENREYVRLICTGVEYDMSDNACEVTTGVATPHMDIRFLVYSKSGENTVAYIDNIVLTQNEP